MISASYKINMQISTSVLLVSIIVIKTVLTLMDRTHVAAELVID